ncbi:hypothetical protein EFQ99_17100 [Rhizobium vallis]|uniref:Uncharacterized protein n=1 Tax=Rhizobium vallis TaxID=634290 RepID=A0A3S0QPK6_9HYPH|nr:hypothetical protein EFQ99_17100 [Rhizobium vallis]
MGEMPGRAEGGVPRHALSSVIPVTCVFSLALHPCDVAQGCIELNGLRRCPKPSALPCVPRRNPSEAAASCRSAW